MKSTNQPDLNAVLVICLDSSAGLWKRLYGIGRSQDHWEVRIARKAHATKDIVTLCNGSTPALLVIEDRLLRELPLNDLSELVTRRDLRILVVTEMTDDSSCHTFFQQGCAGVLAVDAADVTVRKAVRAILEGELWMPRRVLSRLALEGAGRLAGRKLTKRESEILSLIRARLSNQQIADRLFISRETVRWHIRSLYAKSTEARRMGAARPPANRVTEVDSPAASLQAEPRRKN